MTIVWKFTFLKGAFSRVIWEFSRGNYLSFISTVFIVEEAMAREVHEAGIRVAEYQCDRAPTLPMSGDSETSCIHGAEGEGPIPSVSDTTCVRSWTSSDKLAEWAMNKFVPACHNLLDNCRTSTICTNFKSELQHIGTLIMNVLEQEEVTVPIISSEASMQSLTPSSSKPSIFCNATIKAMTNSISLIDSLLEKLETKDCVTPEILKEVVVTVQKITWKIEACGFFRSENQSLKVHDAVFNRRFLASNLGDMLIKASPPDIPKLQAFVEGGRSRAISMPLQPKPKVLSQTKNESGADPEYLPQRTYTHSSAFLSKTQETISLSEHDILQLGLQLHEEANLSTQFLEGEKTGDVDSSKLGAQQIIYSKLGVVYDEEAIISSTETQDTLHSSCDEPEIVKSDLASTVATTSSTSISSGSSSDFTGDTSLQQRQDVKRIRHTFPQRFGSQLMQPVFKKFCSAIAGKRRISVENFVPQRQLQLPKVSRSLSFESAPTNWSNQMSIQSATRRDEEMILVSVELDNRNKDTKHWFRIEVSTNMVYVFGRRQYIILRSSDDVVDLYTNMIESGTSLKFPSSLKLPLPGSSKQDWRRMTENFLQYIMISAELRQSSYFIDFLKRDLKLASKAESQFSTFEHIVTLFTDHERGTLKTIHDQEEHSILPTVPSTEEDDSFLQSLSPQKQGSLIPLVEKESVAGSLKFFSVEENGKSTLIISQEGDEYSLLAGTFDKLVEQLIWTYPEYVNSFVLGYRHFTSPMEMLTHLIKSFDIAVSTIPTAEEIAYIEKWGFIMQLRILDILAYWLTKCWPDFQQNEPVLNTVRSFITDLKSKSDSNFHLAAQSLNDIIIQQLQHTSSRDNKSLSVPTTTGLVTSESSFPITEHTAKQLARELTLHDLQLLQAITAYELATYFWSRNTPEHHCNLTRYAEFFKQVKYWVAAEICAATSPKMSSNIIEAFINVAEHCLAEECNNLNTAMAITHGLQLKSVTVLKNSWKHINLRSEKAFYRLTEVLSRSDNYQNYRRHLHSIRKTTTYIPSFHIFNKDLKSFNKNPKVLKNGLWVFSKVKHMTTEFEKLLKVQQSSYFFPTDHRARALCENLRSSSHYKQFLRSLDSHASVEEDRCLQKLEANYSLDKAPVHQVSIPDKQQQDFENMVETIANGLTTEDILLLAKVEGIPPSLITAPPLTIIAHLYSKGVFNLRNVNDLSKLLNEVGRNDLVESAVQSYQHIHCRDTLPICSTTETPSEPLIPPALPNTASTLPSSPIGNAPTALPQTQLHNDSQTQVYHSQDHGQLPDSVQFSCPPCAYDSETVTFVDPPEVVVFNSTGGTYRNSLHGITLTIPEGAVPDGRSIHIQVGVAMHGPFVWPKRGSIVSPIVGVCMVQPENDMVVLQKLIKIRIPHYVNCLGVEDCKHLTFLKANHKTDVVTINGKTKYYLKPFHVQQTDDEHMQFEPECSFGTLYTKHFCYLCIEKEYTPECTAKTNFCLMGAMPDPPRKSFELYFCVSYMLDTCIQVRNCTIVSLIYM